MRPSVPTVSAWKLWDPNSPNFPSAFTVTGADQVRRQRFEVLRSRHHPDAAAVVPAAGSFDHDRPAVPGAEVAHAGHDRRGGTPALQHGEGRDGNIELGEPDPHQGLVLGELQRVSAGIHGITVRREGADVLARNVFVVEGDNVTAVGKRPQGSEIGVLPDHHIGSDEGRAVLGGNREHAQRLTEGDAGLVRHPRQLAAADHSDAGHTGARVHGAEA